MQQNRHPGQPPRRLVGLEVFLGTACPHARPRLVYGLRQTAIDLDKVNAVSGETGIMFGNISIQDSAGSYQIRNVWKKTVMRFTNRVREAIEARKSRFMQHPADDEAATADCAIAVAMRSQLCR